MPSSTRPWKRGHSHAHLSRLRASPPACSGLFFQFRGVNPGILLDQAERNPPPSTTDEDERGETEIGSIWWPLLSQVGAGKEQLENGGFSVKTRGCSVEKRFPKVWGQVPEKGERGRADKTSGQRHKKLRRYKTTYKCKILLTLWGSSAWFQCIE